MPAARAGVPAWAAAGSVFSVTCGTGLTGGVITTTGTCAVNYAVKADQQTGTSDHHNSPRAGRLLPN